MVIKKTAKKKTSKKKVSSSYTPGRGLLPNKKYKLDTPKGVIGAQDEYNRLNTERQNQLNRPNEYNPYGSQTYETDAQGRTIQRTQLSDAEAYKLAQNNRRDMALGDYAGGQIDRVANAYNNPYSLEGIGNDPRNMDFSADRKRLEDATYQRYADINEPRFQRELNNFDQQMANEGIPPTSEAYKIRRQELLRNQDDARAGARTQSLQLGGSEMERSFNLGSQARQQAVGEYDAQRDRPYSELGNILGLRGPVNNPNFQSRSGIDVPNTDVGGIINNQNQYDLGKRQIASQQSIANAQLALAKSRASGGGGAGPKSQAELDAMANRYR